jgi:hypothetical protein
MHDLYDPGGPDGGLHEPERNFFSFGQLLGVHSFELETSYGIRQRRLLNRLVLGYGVVCGLNVELAPDGDAVVVWPGLAIDRHGREIVVPRRTEPVPIPPQVVRSAVDRVGDRREDVCVQVVICYHECPADPVPMLAGDCDTADPCTPSTIRERYRIEFRDECARRPRPRCHVPDLLNDGQIDHDALARWVTRGRNCTRLAADPCIPLANLRVVDRDDRPHCDPGEVDIGVRPVLPSNLVLLELVTALLERDGQSSDD